MLQDWTKDASIQKIVKFVRWYRAQNGIIPSPGRKFELSCISFGEMYNLLFRQLILTIEFDAGWLELKHSPEVVEGILQEIDTFLARSPLRFEGQRHM